MMCMLTQMVTVDPAGRVNVSELATSLEEALLSEESKSNGNINIHHLPTNSNVEYSHCTICSSQASGSQTIQDRNKCSQDKGSPCIS